MQQRSRTFSLKSWSNPMNTSPNEPEPSLSPVRMNFRPIVLGRPVGVGGYALSTSRSCGTELGGWTGTGNFRALNACSGFASLGHARTVSAISGESESGSTRPIVIVTPGSTL